MSLKAALTVERSADAKKCVNCGAGHCAFVLCTNAAAAAGGGA